MMVRLFEHPTHPGRIAISKLDSFVVGGAFFLDFSRPLEDLKALGGMDRWLGRTVALVVPVVHEGEAQGGYVVGVHRGDPTFRRVRAIWKERYPQQTPSPSVRAEGLKIIADFATQFPPDSQHVPAAR